MISVMGQETGVCRDAILDGFQIHDEIGQALGIFRSENIRIRKFWIERNRNEFGGAGLVAISYGSAIFDSVFIRDNYSNSYSALYLSSGGALKMSDSELSNNGLGGPWGSAGMLSESGGAITLRTSRILMNVGGSRPETAGPFYQVYNQGGGVIDIAYCVVDGLKAGVYPSDDGSYINWGAGNTAP
jgi:hypothetical protein